MTPNLGSLPIDLPRLLETRMLIQSNSGGGKSFCLRRVLEQTAPYVQQLVIDSEGEFATLREKFDYIICAPRGADAVANPQTAAALAVALWGARTSAILDIYELKAHERILFVRRFLEALVNAPRALWNQALVVIDEAHVFAPQGDKAESLGAVIDLATRGRKRGLALLAATQRISKLHKDVAAELLNKAIGRTGLDVDVRRAADELGMNVKEATETLRNLDPGEFFVYGPALTRSVERTKIGPVQTTHPETGKRALVAPPPASPKVLTQLAKIAGLQREAEDEAKTVAALSTELANVRRELTIAKKAQGGGVPEAEVQRRVREALAAVPKTAPAVDPQLAKALAQIARVASLALGATPDSPASVTIHAPRATTGQMARAVAAAPGPTSAGITTPQQRLLDTLAGLEAFGLPTAPKDMLAAHAGVRPTSGGYFNNLGRLRAEGLVDYPAPSMVALTDRGRKIANQPQAAPTLADMHRAWLAICTAPQAAILEVLLGVYPEALAKDDLADRVGVSRTSGGYFNNLGALRTIGAIDYPQKGRARAADVLFPKGAAR